MKFTEELSGVYDKLKTVYDLAAFCYSYLEENISNQIVFMAEYIDANDGVDVSNPNLDLLMDMAMDIKVMLKENLFMLFGQKSDSNSLLSLIRRTENDMVDFEEASMNCATIPFFILLGIDLYIQDRGYEGSKCFPANDFLKETYMVYVNGYSSLMDEVASKREYPAVIETNEIRKYFNYIIFLKTSELRSNYGVPKMVTLCKDESNLKKILNTKQIKIALIPVMREKWFDFLNERGTSFEIKYDWQKEEHVKARVLSLLEKAINYKFNVIVFPEYVCSPGVQVAIGKYLEKMSLEEPERLKELLFVIAGSGWTADSNNVSCVYSYEGDLLGRVYKYSAYNKVIGRVKYYERLQNPGKEVTLINIPGIGIVQTEICRDVSEDEFCSKLARVFEPQFLLIVAWSASVKIGFRKQIDAIISHNRKTCVAMCNCCGAIHSDKRFKDVLGVVAAPQKQESLVEAVFGDVRRVREECCGGCENGCIFEVYYDFNVESEEDVVMTCKFIGKG